MPGFDGTGPYGDGRPGRGLGPCGRFGYGPGRGAGFRGGFRQRNRRFRNDYFYPVYPDYDRSVQPYNEENLKSRRKELERELKWVDEELKEIQQETK